MQCQRDIKSRTEDLNTFKADYKKQKAASPSVGQGGGGGPSVGQGGGGGDRPPHERGYPQVPEGMMSQPEARALLPPSCSIWRGLSNGTWNVRYPPFRRKSYLWSVYGENQAALMCVKFCWERYCEQAGLPQSACPVRGLFPEAPGPRPARPAAKRRVAPKRSRGR